MDQLEARAIVGNVFSSRTVVVAAMGGLYIWFHIFMSTVGMVDVKYCDVSPGRLQLFQLLGPLLALGLFVLLRAIIPGKTQIPRIVAWSLIAVIVGINLWFFKATGSVSELRNLHQTSFCKFAQTILPEAPRR